MYVMEKIRKDYVDADKIAYSSLTRGAMKGMLRGLDPFCSYMDSEGYKQMIEDTEGKEYGGVGLVVTFKNNVLRVIAPMEDSPGFKAGVKPGDVISKIDGKDTAVMTFDECVKHLKGDPGTTLRCFTHSSNVMTRTLNLPSKGNHRDLHRKGRKNH